MPGLCIIPSRALKDDELTPTDLRTLLAIGHFTSRDGSGVWASNATLAEVAGVDARHLQRSMRVLEARGYVRRLERPGTTAIMAIALDEPLEGGAESAPPGGAKAAPTGGAKSAPQTTHRTTQENDSSPARKKLVAEHHRAALATVWRTHYQSRHTIEYELRLRAEGGERPGAGEVPAAGWERVGEALHQLVAAGRPFSTRTLGTFLDGLDPLPGREKPAARSAKPLLADIPDPLTLVGL